MTIKTANAAELASNSSVITAIIPPREGTKQAKLVSMLSRKSGITLPKASEALGWQTHTTSASMTGLRKRGYKTVREPRDGKDAIYRIETASKQTKPETI